MTSSGVGSLSPLFFSSPFFPPKRLVMYLLNGQNGTLSLNCVSLVPYEELDVDQSIPVILATPV